jgi:glycosyltransferase involved in cell wall biosynthesis
MHLLHGLGSLSPTPRCCSTILTIHDLIYHHYPHTVPRGHRWFMKAVLPVVAQRAARIIVPSRSTAKDVIGHLGVDERRVRVIPYGRGQDLKLLDDPILIDDCERRFGIRRPYIISVCRTYPHKNLAGLLRAFAVLRKERRDVQLVLVGERYRTGEALDRLASELGIVDSVRITGFVDQRTLNVLYSAAAVFAFPSLAEGLGLPVLEAMACGTPVVASKVSAVPEAVGDAGLLTDTQNPDAFAQSLGQVLDDAKLQAELREKGLARMRQFSWERCAKETIAVYQELI